MDKMKNQEVPEFQANVEVFGTKYVGAGGPNIPPKPGGGSKLRDLR